MASLTRTEKRTGYDDHTRITLLENDADEAEERQERIEKKLDTIRNWLLTGAITFGSSAVLLAANIVIQMSGGK